MITLLKVLPHGSDSDSSLEMGIWGSFRPILGPPGAAWPMVFTATIIAKLGFHGYRKAKERLMGIRQVGKQSSLLPPRFRHLSRIQAPEVFTILW